MKNGADQAEALVARIRALAAAPGLDVIVVDDGSTDGTSKALAVLDRDVDVLLLRNPESLGVALSRNRALRHAGGEYIWFVDHDDEWDVSGVNTLRGHAGGADIVVGRAEFRWGPGATERRTIDGRNVGSEVDGREAGRMLLTGELHGFLWSKLIRRKTLGDAPFPDQRSQSDVVGVATAVANAVTVRFIPELVYTYLRLPGSLTRVREPSSAALRSAHDRVVEAVGHTANGSTAAYFTAWFYCLALVKTAVRWRVTKDARKSALTEAATAARHLSPIRLARHSASIAIAIAVLRIRPSLLAGIVALGFSLLDIYRELRENLSAVAQRLGGFVLLPAISLLIPLLVLPGITRSLGAAGWVAVAVAQSLGGAGSVLVDLGWSTTATQRVARQSPANRSRHLAWSLAVRSIAGVPVALVAAAMAAVLVSDHRAEAAALAAIVTLSGNGTQWFFVGIGSPRMLVWTDAVPRVVLLGVAMIVMAHLPSLWVYVAAMGLGSLASTVGAIVLARCHWTDLRGLTRRRLGRILAIQFTALSARALSAGYIALPIALVGIVAPASVPTFAAAERLQRTALSGLQMFPNAMQGWVGSPTGSERLRRARLAVVSNVGLGVVCGSVYALAAPTVSHWLFSGVATISFSLSVFSGLLILITCTSRATGGLMLVSLGRVGGITQSAAAGLVVGVPAIVIGALLAGAHGALAAEVLTEAVVLAVQFRAIRIAGSERA
jgi:O-antigen/teichoic acid export membrane protein